MKAAVIKEYGTISLQEVKKPELPEGNVLVRVKYASICGSDQHIFAGEFHPRTRLPLIPGHEFAGVVEETGRLVTKFKPGNKVTVDPIIWCGKCIACQEQHYPACISLRIVGIDLDGGFAEYVSVPESMVYRVPDHISDEYAALLEIISIGFHASARAGLKKEDDILIVGSGKVGQAILHAAKTITSGKVFIADILNQRLDLAKSAFPDVYPVNIMDTDPVKFIKDVTGGKGVDIAFEAVGHEVNVEGRHNPVRTAINAIKGGGKVCALGLSDHPSPILMKELIWKEAEIIASRVTHGEFSTAIEAIASGKLDPGKMITSVLDLKDAQKGFEILEKDPASQLKILLKI